MYIAHWTDTTISVVPNLPVNLDNTSGTPLSPLADISALTFPQSLLAGTLSCPVMPNDRLTFTVTNPQSGGQATLSSVKVALYGTAPN
ncbi:MAG: hypothetical protein ACLP59_30510 [Bryobacteraceae bacterium]